MPLRMGELMVVVRAQDFASRTLRRVSGELSGMSQAEAVAQRRSQLMLRQMQQAERIRTTMQRGRGLELLKHRIQLEEQLQKLQAMPPTARIQGPGGFVSRGAAIGQLTTALAASQKQFDLLDPSMQRFDTRIRGMAQPIAMLDAALEGNKRKMTQLGVSAGMTRREIAAFEKAIRAIPIQRLDNIGHAMGGVGRTMQLFGAVSTAALGVAANSFAKFQSQVTLAATQTRNAGESFVKTAANADRLGTHILEMMRQFPASAEEMAQAAYDIYSSIDVNFTNGIKLLRLFNKVAVAGGTDLQTATHASITVLENFDKTLVKTGHISDRTNEILNQMFAIVRYGRLNFAQLDHVLTSVVPAAKGAGMTFEDVAGAIAVVSRTLDATKTGPAIARLIEVFTNPDFRRGMKNAGRSVEDLKGNLLPFPAIIDRIASLNARDLNDVLRIVSALGRGSGRGREFTVQARRALIQLVAGINEYRRVQKLTTSDNDEFRNSFLAMSQTLGVRWKVFLNQLKVLVLYIGEQAIPVFLKIGDVISGWLDKWRSLSDGTRRTIVQWTAILAVSSLVAGVFLSIAGALVTMYAALRMSGPRITGVAGDLTKLSVALRGIAAISAITIGIELIRKGGGWALLGGVIGGAGLGGLLRGGRGAIGGATIAIGLELVMKGQGWSSRIGQILMGTGLGFATGGPAGALLGTFAATIPVIIETKKAEDDWGKTLARMGRRTQEIARTLAAAQNIPFKTAETQVFNRFNQKVRESMQKGMDSIDAVKFAINWLNKFEQTLRSRGGPRDAFDAMARQAERGMNRAVPKQSLREMLKSAKSFTEIMAIVNQQTAAATDNMEKLAIAIARATAKGNFATAAKLLNDYANTATKKLTGANITKLITQAVESGDIRQATQYLQDWTQQIQQGRADMEQYRKSMQEYGKQLAETSKQAAVDVISNLRSMWDQMQQENQQAFGELFQGPWLTSETFDIAKEWGIQPRIQDMIKDLQQQNNVFARWRRTLDRILKRGLPRGFVDEIRKMGPEQGQAFLDNLLKAKPGQVAKLVAQWKRRNAQIQNATKMDFRSEIEHFRKAGVSMGEAIINGFQSAQTAKWFDNWVKVTFPGVINTAVATAVRDWKKANPPPTRPNVPTTAAGANAARTAGVTQPSTTTNDNSKKWEVHIRMPHDEGAAQTYAANKEAARRAAFAVRNVLKGLT